MFVLGLLVGAVVMGLILDRACRLVSVSRERWKNVAIKSGNLSAVSECLHLDALEGVDP